jgi:uncharacterized spore protein YtfJ
MEQDLNQCVDTLFTNITGFTQQDGLIGKPVSYGDKTFLPVMSLMLGYGGGDSKSKGKQSTDPQNGGLGSMIGGALGIGAKLCTDAIIIIDKDQTSVTPIGMGAAGKGLTDKIPEIISSMKQGGQQSGQQSGQSGQNQQPQQSGQYQQS